jgi:hypothetical protein
MSTVTTHAMAMLALIGTPPAPSAENMRRRLLPAEWPRFAAQPGSPKQLLTHVCA